MASAPLDRTAPGRMSAEDRRNQIVAIAAEHGEHLVETPDSVALAAFLEKRRGASPDSFADLSLAIVKLIGLTQQLAVTPYAFVNLKVGGGPATAPQFIIDGTASDYVAFPAFSGDDDSNRPGRERRRRAPWRPSS